MGQLWDYGVITMGLWWVRIRVRVRIRTTISIRVRVRVRVATGWESPGG
jgi:hypothetical protein